MLRSNKSEPVFSVGILMFPGNGERLLGDPGREGTFPFPVKYKVVQGSYQDLIEGSQKICDSLCNAAVQLESEGVSAIAGDCGLMVLYQEQLAKSVKVPVIASSLILLPMLQDIFGREKNIGIITGHSKLLSERHLSSAGVAQDSNITIVGLENGPHFKEAVLDKHCSQNYDRMMADVFSAVDELLNRTGEVGAILLECSNLPTYARAIADRYKTPVFDVTMALKFLAAAAKPERYI